MLQFVLLLLQLAKSKGTKNIKQRWRNDDAQPIRRDNALSEIRRGVRYTWISVNFEQNRRTELAQNMPNGEPEVMTDAPKPRQKMCTRTFISACFWCDQLHLHLHSHRHTSIAVTLSDDAILANFLHIVDNLELACYPHFCIESI